MACKHGGKLNPYLHPAKLISYNQTDRTAQISIKGLTDGEPDGLTAMLAYPIGDDDLDTERELNPGADVWVFFEAGDMASPVIAFYRSHGEGRAVTDVRRIRQKNIELLARSTVTIDAKNLVDIRADRIRLEASNIEFIGDIAHTGNQSTRGTVTASVDVKAGSVSLNKHTHGGVVGGNSNTRKPN